jgi:hypothetical protein
MLRIFGENLNQITGKLTPMEIVIILIAISVHIVKICKHRFLIGQMKLGFKIK